MALWRKMKFPMRKALNRVATRVGLRKTGNCFAEWIGFDNLIIYAKLKILKFVWWSRATEAATRCEGLRVWGRASDVEYTEQNWATHHSIGRKLKEEEEAFLQQFLGLV